MQKQELLSLFTIKQMSDGVFWLDQSGRFFWVNPAASRMLGYEISELLELSVFDINPSMTPEVWATHWNNQVKENTRIETQHKKKEGKLFPVEITNNFIEYEGNTYACSIIRDITERKQKESALRGALMEIRSLKEKLEEENNYLQEEINTNQNFGEIITQSETFRAVLSDIGQVAATNSTVLITGESGTGKELIARSIHRLSKRCDRPMIKVNCAALPANLIESELFGHEKGAFTGALTQKKGRFEIAHQGTLFLDEIGEMPLELQAKLLRVLQEGEFEPVGSTRTLKVDVRILAATNRTLLKEVEKERFREDLYYRLNVFPIHCIPLRERKEDIPLLVKHFCEKFESKIGKKISHIPKKVIQTLQLYDFPGNIRELENFIERAIILSKNGKLLIGDWLPKSYQKRKSDAVMSLEAVQKEHIIQVLQMTNWRISGDKGAARMLNIKPTTLESRMKKLNISRSMDIAEE